MDITQLVVTVFATAAVNIVVIVWLYSYWIIPEIVKRTKDELMTNIENWIAQTRDELSNTIIINLDEMRQKIVSTISGFRGNKQRQLSLASQFLTANLDPEEDPESDNNQSVITDAIAAYGERIVKAALKSITTKPQAEETTAGW